MSQNNLVCLLHAFSSHLLTCLLTPGILVLASSLLTLFLILFLSFRTDNQSIPLGYLGLWFFTLISPKASSLAPLHFHYSQVPPRRMASESFSQERALFDTGSTESQIFSGMTSLPMSTFSFVLLLAIFIQETHQKPALTVFKAQLFSLLKLCLYFY